MDKETENLAHENVNRRGEPFPHDFNSNLNSSDTLKYSNKIKSKKKNPIKIFFLIIFISVVIIFLAIVSVYIYYKNSLEPVDTSSKKVVQFEINKGDTMNSLAAKLKMKNLIKDKNTFKYYVSMNKESKVVPGIYHFNKSMNVENIVKDIREGNVAEFNITFKPGQTIFDIKESLKKIGYKDEDINKAFMSNYSKYPYVKSRGNQKSLEGLIFPETFRVGVDYSPKNVLSRPIAHMQEYINEKNLEDKFKKQGLSLYQGIILASILQKESPSKDMPDIAGLFLNRIKKDMPLGADSTAAYGAKVYNQETSTVAESIKIDTPYNTRIHKGLPPTPISVPSAEALEAVANPKKSDYIFFVSGDDGTTHYSKTNEEHENNTKRYCKIRCKL